MDTLQERGLLEGLAVRDDRTIDLTELARRALESALNQVMDAQADELRGEGNRRNGYRERRLPAVVGEATPRMPRPGEGSHFPEGLPRPCSRVDRATVACAREAYVRGLSARKMEAAAVTAIACGGGGPRRLVGPGCADEEIRRRARAVSVLPPAGAMGRLVGSALTGVDEEWMSMGFIDAASLLGGSGPRGPTRSPRRRSRRGRA
jgi:transposase-like protein